MTEIKYSPPENSSPGQRHIVRNGLRRAVLCALILTLMPLWPAPQPVQARGLLGFVSKAVPFIGVEVARHQRNRVYRSSNRFIRDRNDYYDGLIDMARQQFRNKELATVGNARIAAYVKVVVLIEQERAGQIKVAEGRKRQAREQFQLKLKDALVSIAVGSRFAQELLGSMLKGVDSMEGVVNRALSKLTTGGSDFLQDMQRLKKFSYYGKNISSVFGGRFGAKVRGAFERISSTIEKGELGAAEAAGLVKGELQSLRDELFVMKERGRKPGAGEALDYITARFLPGSEQEGSIPMESIASILSELEVGDGSLKDEAQKALNAGFVARCSAFSQDFEAQLEKLANSGQEGSESDSGETTCKAYNGKEEEQKAEDEKMLDQILEYGEDDEEEKLPQITASGTFSEEMSGPCNTSKPMGTTFELTADYAAGTISGTLKGSRALTPGGWMNCHYASDPSNELERVKVDTTDSYEASFSGSIDKETGEFSADITPTGGTTATKVTLFTDDRCLFRNDEKWPGEGGWNGKGAISGGVSKDGGIEFNTSWNFTWPFGEVEVAGQWSGNGIVKED